MEHLLQNLVQCSHPESVKQQIVDQFVSQHASAFQPVAESRAILTWALQSAVTSDSPFARETGAKVFVAWSANHRDALTDVLTPTFIDDLLADRNDRPYTPSVLFDLLNVCLAYVEDSRSLHGVCGVVARRCASTLARDPSWATTCALSSLLLAYPECVPSGIDEVVLTTTLAEIVMTDDTTCVRSDESVRMVCGLFETSFSSFPKDVALEVLRTMFAKAVRTKEPSAAFGAIVRCVAAELAPEATVGLLADPSVTDERLGTFLRRAFRWLRGPTGRSAVAKWIVHLLHGLAAKSKFSLLIDVSREEIEDLFGLLVNSNANDGLMDLFAYVILSYQHSADVFHKIVNSVPSAITKLEKESSETNAKLLIDLSEILHAAMSLHSGFPELYDPMLSALKPYPKPSNERMNQLVNQNKWDMSTAYVYSLPHYYPSRSSTGKLGLLNLGNTCYMNSVIQALYMTEEFCSAVLKARVGPNETLMAKLQYLFAYLTHSERRAVNATEFFRASRPPWFEIGHQQDCSEYLRHLLDSLHEQEKRTTTTSLSSETHAELETHTELETEVVKMDDDTHCENNESLTETLVQETFAGCLVVSYRCLRCGCATERTEPFIDLHLAFPAFHDGDKTLGLSDMLNFYFAPETLKGENSYHCQRCDGLTTATRSTRIVKTPPHLVLTLLRFSYDASSRVHAKILADVQYPLVLDVPVSNVGDGDSERTRRVEKFHLYAVVLHSGVSSDGGHYYAYGRPPSSASREADDEACGRWYHFNDSDVTFSSYSSFRTISKRFPKDTAYMLFYQKAPSGIVEYPQVESDPKLVVLSKEIKEAIAHDNLLHHQEEEKELQKTVKCRTIDKTSFFDDHNPPGSCGGGGGFGSDVPRFVF